MRYFLLSAVVAAFLTVFPVTASGAAVAIGHAGQSSGNMNSDTIRDTASRVMEQHDYRSVRRRVLENVPDRTTEESHGFLLNMLSSMGRALGDFLEWLFSGMFTPGNPGGVTPPAPATSPSSGGGLDFSFGKLLLYMAFAVVILVSVWLIAAVFKASDGRRRLDRDGLFGDEEDPANLSAPPGEQAASTYESRAIQMAAGANYRGAIRELLVGSMSWIERAGLIRYRRGLTNRDYVRAVWRQQDRRDAYVTTAIEFERVYFGRREATQEMFEDCLRSFQGSFREEETTAKV